jgi:phosphomannomutase
LVTPSASPNSPPSTSTSFSDHPFPTDDQITATFTKTQNGSDIRGITLDLIPEEHVTLSPYMMFYIAGAFADWLANKLNKPHSSSPSLKISIGADPRLSSPLISAAMTAGLASRGSSSSSDNNTVAIVGSFGLCTTPAMFMSCIMEGHDYDGAIMITASHLPVNRNGAKFFTKEGGLDKPDIKWILQRATELYLEEKNKNINNNKKGGGGMYPPPLDPHGQGLAVVLHQALLLGTSSSPSSCQIKKVDFLPVYAAHLRKVIIDGVNHPSTPDKPLTGFKIIVNAGNGGGGFFASQVLQPLGADISGSVHLDANGYFPAHPSNPEDKRAVEATVKAVIESGGKGVDLGLMFDTDVDRSGIVDASGRGINRNRYIALMSAITLRDHPGGVIVTDSCTSNGLAAFIKDLGGVHFRYKKGYKNIINKGVELNESGGVNCPLMMETSGHGAMKENYFLDDGAYSAVKVVIEAVKRRLELGPGKGDISALLADLKEPVEAMEIRVKILADDVRAEGEAVTAAFHDWVVSGAAGNDTWQLEDENYEGWRVVIDEGSGGRKGWLLLRPSLHDPDVVINVESEKEGGMKESLKHLLEFFREKEGMFEISTKQVEGYVSG